MDNELLKKYFKLINSDLNKVEFTFQDKNSVYIPLFSSSIDHCISINVLKDQNLTTSMYALIRPSIDNYLRAMWVKYCDEAGLPNVDLTDMHFHKRIERLIEEVFQERPDLENDHSLKSVIEHTLKNMHDFTHGGIQSIARQYDEDGVTLTYKRDKEEISSIVKFSILISILSYLEIIQENTSDVSLNSGEINKLAKELIGL
jgi:hypothetical protein